MFHCDKCGLCCMHIGSSPIFSALDRGDGVCKFFVDETRLCSIYRKRPTLCNVDKAYEVYYKDELTQQEYYEINYRSCKELKEKYSSS